MPHKRGVHEDADGSKLGAAKVGPYLAVVYQTYNVAIDSRFTSGQCKYICTPHVSQGMKGTIAVTTLP